MDTGPMQDAAYGLPGILLLRTPVNKLRQVFSGAGALHALVRCRSSRVRAPQNLSVLAGLEADH